MYVRDVAWTTEAQGVDGFVRTWLEAAAAQGYGVAELEEAFGRLAHETRRKEFLVVDPDPDLARILAAEIREGLGYAVASASFEGAAAQSTNGVSILTLPTHVERATRELKAAGHIGIVLRSLDELLIGHRRLETAALIGLVSRSESIRKWSATLLSALGFPPNSVLLRSPDEARWKRGLSACTLVAADIEAFAGLPPTVKSTEMRLVSPEFVKLLR